MLRKMALYGALILTLAACGKADTTAPAAATPAGMLSPTAAPEAATETPTRAPTLAPAAADTAVPPSTTIESHATPTGLASLDSLAAADHHTLSDLHIRLVEQEPASSEEVQRAAEITAAARQSLAKYEDYRAALADGYWILAPEVDQEIYHFVNTNEAYRNRNLVDPARPTSLLYEKTAAGWRWAGVMYSAPMDAAREEIDAHYPVNVGQWHAHVNLCLPADRQNWRAALTDPRFGFSGSIDNPVDCAAAGGRFVEDLFGWMVHVTW